MRFRASEQHWNQIKRLTDSSFVKGIDKPSETGCIILFAENDHPARPSLLASCVLAPSQGDLLHQTAGTLTLSHQYLRRALLTVRERGLKGFFTVHTHPLSDETVCFSSYDNENDPDLMSNLYDLQPTGLFGSIVLGRNSACARLWVDGEPRYLRDLVIIGEQITFVSDAPSKPPPAAALFDRGIMLTGSGALYRLSQLRVAVIGASGTGSLMIELLTRAGIGELVVFEFDGADETNLNRVTHLRMKDAQANVNKGKRLAEAMAETGLPTRVTIVEGGDIRDPDVADVLRSCDLLVGCVDRDWPRLILSEVSYQYLIPYVDLGTEIGALLDGDEIQSVDARVSYVGPGRPCLGPVNTNAGPRR